MVTHVIARDVHVINSNVLEYRHTTSYLLKVTADGENCTQVGTPGVSKVYIYHYIVTHVGFFHLVSAQPVVWQHWNRNCGACGTVPTFSVSLGACV